jgi:hypothetical protein
MGRVLIAGVLAGLAMFFWETIAHMALPFGEMGLSTLPNEEATRQLLAAQMGNADGLFFFPDLRAGAEPSPGPWGMLLYHPQLNFSSAVFAWEVMTELVQGLALALLISLSAVSDLGKRMTIASLVGIAAAFSTSPSFSIWFGFPLSYTLGQMLVTFVDYLIAGLVIAALLRPRRVAAAV